MGSHKPLQRLNFCPDRLLEPVREKVESDESVVVPWSALLFRRRTDVES